MDPNAALSEFRDLMSEIRKLDALISIGDERTDEFEARDDLALDAARVMADLDEWIAKGGFLPEAWLRRHELARTQETTRALQRANAKEWARECVRLARVHREVNERPDLAARMLKQAAASRRQSM